ncbi:hypothetical protein [Fibrella aquatilis]|uniref:Bulb-type lectin domain-containing protein n=1 Tax=Fibrella aquatilis TaxID=2817059 RepID=A0A939G7H5_9BACT|nr:hypothetical protein [Fibrella aquatilis]MBO0931577.1 hypothetical protein [Fibrella aquatilis]
MKTQCLAVFALLLSLTTAFAQPPTNNGDVNAAERPAQLLASANWRMKVGDAPLLATRGNDAAELALERNALVAKKTVTITTGDDMGAHTSVVWSIPLSGAVNELVFQPDGNLVVVDTANKVLWQTNTKGQGHILRFYGDGVLDLFDKTNGSVWRK